jgi:hypothetical protein
MQSTTSKKLSEKSFWYPSPESIDSLTVITTDDGFQLSAPIGTELAAWFDYYDSTPELHDEFEAEFKAMIKQRLDTTE